jgi:hypothetical protein
VHSPELGDRIVAVFNEDSFIKFFCARNADRGIDTFVTRQVEVADELVEKQSPQTFGGAAVAGEESALHRFGQIDQRKNWQVEIGEIAAKNCRLTVAELFWNVDRHESRYYER